MLDQPPQSLEQCQASNQQYQVTIKLYQSDDLANRKIRDDYEDLKLKYTKMLQLNQSLLEYIQAHQLFVY